MERPKDKEKQSALEKLKNTGVKKISRVVVSIFFIFALVFATITNLTFTTFDFKKWLANTLILVGILIFGMVIGESGAIDTYRQNETGTYKTNVKEYNAFITLLKPFINNFDYWYGEQLPKELEQKKINFLIKNGIRAKTARNIVKYCKSSDIYSLTQNDATKVIDLETDTDIYIEKIESYQKEAVAWVLDGKIKLNSPNANYFTTLYNDDLTGGALSEQGNVLAKTRNKIKNINRTMRVFSTVVISVVMGSLTVSELMKGDDVQAWLNLITRISGFLTSVLSGFLSGKVLVNYDARIIKNKYEVLLRYYNDIQDGGFVIKDEQEILKEKYEQQQKREEEAISLVCDSTDTSTAIVIKK